MNSMPEFHNMLLMNILKMLIGWEFEKFSTGVRSKRDRNETKRGQNWEYHEKNRGSGILPYEEAAKGPEEAAREAACGARKSLRTAGAGKSSGRADVVSDR